MGEAAAALAGAAVTALLALTVVVVQQLLHRRRESRREAAERLAAFSAAAWSMTNELGLLARAPVEEKGHVEAGILSSEGARLNSALACIQLLDGAPVYRAALNVDDALVLLADRARREQWARDEWRVHRSSVLRHSLARFGEEARRQIGSDPIEVEATLAPER